MVSGMDHIPTRQALDCPKKEVGHKSLNTTEIPDINLELPAPTDKLEPTSSRTQSLDRRLFLDLNEQPSPLKADICPATLLDEEPGSRWVKRLKLSASRFLSVGTKSSNLSAKSSHEKANKSHSKISRATTTGSELAAGKFHGEELVAHDRNLALARNSDEQDLLTSLSWVQRWLHNRSVTAQKRPQSMVVCEPQCSKLELGDFQKKHSPSIAAMALMGKAITCFQPCEFQKRGPYVVWKTVVSAETHSSNSYCASD
ncbi:F-box protein At2g16365-like isoform X2 [Lycium barbarum]|uniref:F-box protein At2g16365-like isoform X2 n=1 Tax=Lycium barbarum TaxID=112863 RepID=UPI00293EC582|nr:F-box protein At2g16365-like isoform X2 [Lycium barbarum]